MEGLTIWYKISYISPIYQLIYASQLLFLFFSNADNYINALREKKIYNAIYVVHFLITSILHKLDIRVPLGEPKSSSLRAESTDFCLKRDQ